MARKKKKLGLPIMAGTLAILAIGYVGLTEYQAQKEEKESIQASLEEEANKTYLNKMEDIVSIHYKNETDELAFTKTDEKWVVTDLTDFPLDQSYVEEMETLLQSLTATRTFNSPDALEAYGLDEPVLNVEATDAEGNEFSICFGNTYDSEYYVYINGDESVVYTIEDSLLTATSYGLYDMVVLEEVPILTEANIKTIKFDVSGESYLIEKETTIVEVEPETESNEESEDATSEETTEAETTEAQTEEITTWYVSKNDEERQELSDEAQEEIIYMLSHMEVNRCVNYKANETELADYGFGEDTTTITVTYGLEEESETIVFHIGNLDVENAVYYMTMDDSTAIHTVDEELLEALMDGNMEILQQ